MTDKPGIRDESIPLDPEGIVAFVESVQAASERRVLVLTHGQYDRFHAELIRALGDDAVKSIVIQAEEPVEYPPMLNLWGDLLTRHKLRADDARVRRQPDYLKHDPTKRHGRR